MTPKYEDTIQQRHTDGFLVLPGEARSLAMDVAIWTRHRSAAVPLNGLFEDLTNSGTEALGVNVSYGAHPDAHVSVGIFTTVNERTDKTFHPDVVGFRRRLGPLFTFRFVVLHVPDVAYDTVTQEFGRRLTQTYAPGESSVFTDYGRSRL